jgi:hypothetical protein
MKLFAHMAAERVHRGEPPAALLGFSEAGTKIWSHVGAATPSREVIWSVHDLPDSLPLNPEAHYLDLADIPSLAALDSELLGNQLRRRPADATRFCIRPTAAMYEASLTQANETLRHLRGARRVPTKHGVRLSATVYAIWIHYLPEDALCFLRFQAGTREEARAIVAAAAEEARWWGLPRLTAWDMDEALLVDPETGEETWTGVRSSARTTCVAMAAWMDEGDEKLDWAFIERFGLVLES